MSSNLPKILTQITESVPTLRYSELVSESKRQETEPPESLRLPNTNAEARYRSGDSLPHKYTVLERRRKRRLRGGAGRITPSRRLSVEYPTREERRLQRAVCVGAFAPAVYSIALRLLRQGVHERDVARKLELPREEVNEIQAIRLQAEATPVAEPVESATSLAERMEQSSVEPDEQPLFQTSPQLQIEDSQIEESGHQGCWEAEPQVAWSIQEVSVPAPRRDEGAIEFVSAQASTDAIKRELVVL